MVDWLGPGLDQELNRVGYELFGPAPHAAAIEMCATLGSPPVPNVVIVGGQSITPVTIDGQIDILAPFFRRGDCNRDDTVEVADPIFLINFLFSGGAAAFCQDACDSNDDGVLDLADGIYTLQYLFAGGPAPPAPFPDCGEDDTDDALRCSFPLLCP